MNPATLSRTELFDRLTSYRMMPQLIRENILDQAIASISCTEAERIKACQQFYAENQLNDRDRQAWLQQHHMSQEFLETVFIPRLLKIEKFKDQQWNPKLDSYFLQRKPELDQVIYSLIRVQSAELAEELYFRLDENEQSFAELARQYSQGPEAWVNGIFGPVELGTLHPTLMHLFVHQPGLCQPVAIGQWVVIVRLEKLIPAQLDRAMRQRLLRELLEVWLQEQMRQLEHN